MKTYIPPKYKTFWKRHIFAAAYGRAHSQALLALMRVVPEFTKRTKKFDPLDLYWNPTIHQYPQ